VSRRNGSGIADRSARLPTVLYVGGVGRSGSTLLGRVLGEASEAVCVGETRYIWSRGLLNNVRCGCGQPFRSCVFWSAIGEEAFGGWEQIDAERYAEVDRIAEGLRRLPHHCVPALHPELAAAIAEYVPVLTRLYSAMARVSGAQVVVETSKDPNFASLLMRMPESDVRIVHLVRDSRAVAYSWTRKRRMPSPIGAQTFMPRFKPASTALSWLVSNSAFHLLRAGRCRYVRTRYESFVDDPQRVLGALSDFAGAQLLLPPEQLVGRKVELGGHHIFSGNPMRASTGWVDIDLDDEWRRSLPTSQRLAVTALTWPLLGLYGYDVIPATRRRTASSARHRRVAAVAEEQPIVPIGEQRGGQS
jgi:hypothetical protein